MAAPAVFFLAVFYVLSKIALELFVRPKNGRKLEGKYQTQKVFVLFFPFNDNAPFPFSVPGK